MKNKKLNSISISIAIVLLTSIIAYLFLPQESLGIAKEYLNQSFGVIKTILIFSLSLAILVGIHEYGHYLAARISGVKVLEYSIGFGPRIMSWTSKKTGILYSLSAIPLGGFVKMLLNKEADNKESKHYGQHDKTFDNAPLWNRFWIVFWGPLTNGILAIVILAAIGTGSKSYIPPILGETYSVAKEAGLEKNDQIKSINGKEVNSWNEFMMELSLSTGKENVPIEINRNDEIMSLTADFSKYKISREKSNFDHILGFHFILERGNEINLIKEGEAASENDFHIGDKIISINGNKTKTMSFIVNELTNSKNELSKIKINRNGKIIEKEVLIPNTGKIGISLALNKSKEEINKIVTYKDVGFIDATKNSFKETYNISILTVKFLWKIVTNETSVTSLSGPVSMAKATETGFDSGTKSYFYIIALLSINLMVLNLLPIPVLDGGHITFTLIEAVFRPVPEKIQEFVSLIFGGLLIFFMISVTIYDIYKIFY